MIHVAISIFHLVRLDCTSNKPKVLSWRFDLNTVCIRKNQVKGAEAQSRFVAMFGNIGNILSQGFPPKPTFTEQQLQDLSGKVVIVTGGYSGVGYQLSKLLYAKNAVVYIAGRREDVGQEAIASLKAADPDSKGRLEFLQLDLADLSTIKASANAFLEKETRLDVLWNNAGIMRLPKDSPTHSKQVCRIHFLLV